jgi:hypothetical protein
MWEGGKVWIGGRNLKEERDLACACNSSLGAQLCSGVDNEVLSLFQSQMRRKERSGTASLGQRQAAG